MSERRISSTERLSASDTSPVPHSRSNIFFSLNFGLIFGHFLRLKSNNNFVTLRQLLQMQKQYKLITPGASVLDLGCAPGAWLQVKLTPFFFLTLKTFCKTFQTIFFLNFGDLFGILFMINEQKCNFFYFLSNRSFCFNSNWLILYILHVFFLIDCCLECFLVSNFYGSYRLFWDFLLIVIVARYAPKKSSFLLCYV